MRVRYPLAGDMQIEKYIPYSNCHLKLHITWASYTRRNRLNRLIGFTIKEYIILPSQKKKKGIHNLNLLSFLSTALRLGQ